MKLFIFGATGDLVRRKVLPALQELGPRQELEIIALGRKEMSRDEYLSNSCGLCSSEFKMRIKYRKIDFEKSIFGELVGELDKNSKNYFYVSLPPSMLRGVLGGLKEIVGMGFDLSILVEKPFGHDLKDALVLRDVLAEIDDRVFLADHYLFKDEVEKLGKDFSKIRFVFLEKVGLEGRSYYDEIGAIKDMLQSHFLNLLFVIEPSIKHDLKLFSIEKFSRGQYEEYKKEIGKDSDTETFVDLILKTQRKHFEFTTGKAFSKKQSCIFVDGRRIDFNEKINPYVKMFEEFIGLNKERFPKIDDAIFSCKLVEWVLKNKSRLNYYPSGKDFVCENI